MVSVCEEGGERKEGMRYWFEEFQIFPEYFWWRRFLSLSYEKGDTKKALKLEPAVSYLKKANIKKNIYNISVYLKSFDVRWSSGAHFSCSLLYSHLFLRWSHLVTYLNISWIPIMHFLPWPLSWSPDLHIQVFIQILNKILKLGFASILSTSHDFPITQ